MYVAYNETDQMKCHAFQKIAVQCNDQFIWETRVFQYFKILEIPETPILPEREWQYNFNRSIEENSFCRRQWSRIRCLWKTNWGIDRIGYRLIFGVSTLSAISWRPVLVVEEARIPRENHRPWASNWQALSLAAASRVDHFL